MNIESKIQAAIVAAFDQLYGHQLTVEEASLQPTRKEFEGTHTFVTFPYLRVSRQKPEETGAAIGDFLKANHGDLVESYNVVKGFLNLKLHDSVWIQVLNSMTSKNTVGQLADRGEKVMVEFSSPNTNKPLHLGHLRNNFLGDSVSRILAAAGYDVMKTNLVNDRGIHICKSMLAYERFGEEETPESAGIKGDHLAGKYYVRFDQEYKKEIEQLKVEGQSEEEAKKNAPLMIEAQNLLKRWEEKDPEAVALWEKMNNWVYQGFDQTYNTMGISFDKIYHESETYLLGKDIVDEGLKKDKFFKKEDGSVWIDLSDEGLDQKLVLRADGTSVYMTQDMGTCDFKYSDFPMDKSVYVVGNEQDYHFKVLFSIMSKLGRSYGEGLYHLSYGMVDLPTGKMKSREGTVVDADDLMQEMFDTAEEHTRELGKIDELGQDGATELYKILGLGALKYFLLKVDPKKRMLFDPRESIEFHGNTGPFIQYTHARIAAILRRAEAENLGEHFDGVSELHERELAIVNQLVRFDSVIEQSANDYSPAVVAQYVYDLARDYNGFYQEVSIFNEADADKLQLRIALSRMTAKVISRSMELLGIAVPERM